MKYKMCEKNNTEVELRKSIAYKKMHVVGNEVHYEHWHNVLTFSVQQKPI